MANAKTPTTLRVRVALDENKPGPINDAGNG